ncbi:hypothetical protein ACPV5J_07490 [Vibrio rotiferianus]|uniref:hypothetical protein n=1 Tax=Vibrio rotiferianus TaxID=190895 RepID=UPI00406A5398
MIVNNPQDFTPILAAMKAELKADMDALTLGVQQSNSSLAQTMATEFDAITAVNGEISTEVQAINAHTTAELGSLSLSSIKNIYRISGSGNITIPEVDVTKTVLNKVSTYNGYISSGRMYDSYATLVDSTTVSLKSPYGSWKVYVEVIEYA